jgi:chromate transport protein ChrA
MGDIEGLPHKSRCHPSLPRAKLQLQVHRSLILLALTRSQVAIYLGALTASSAGIGSWITALIAFVAIFFPGLALATGMNPVWKYLRRYQAVASALRGVNAATVGLVWTAVYRLWEAGNLSSSSTTVQTLGSDPWWLVIAAISFSSNQWYGVAAPVCIVLGEIMGLLRWSVTN